MARYLQQVYCPQGFPLPVGSQAPTDQSPACAPMVRSFEPVAARSPVSVTIEQRTAREAARNCCRTEFVSQHVLRSSWSLLLEERRSILVVMRPCHGRSCLCAVGDLTTRCKMGSQGQVAMWNLVSPNGCVGST